MAFSVATYGGVAIFGLVESFVATVNPVARQETAFFGANGLLSKFGGSRGTTFRIRGVLNDTTIFAVNADEQIILSYADGIARTLTDVRGRFFTNVVFDGAYEPHPMGPRPTDRGWCLEYTMILHGLI
jgi:hypothetical protein